MKRFALLGEPLGHSVSPALHKAIYRQLELDDVSYRAIELPEERLKSFFSGFRVGGFDGVNVTIPHKSAVFSLLDEVDSKAKLINAVNCIHRTSNRLTGYNTDLLGFAYTLRENGVSTEGKTFAILGAGGSALAVGVALAEGEVGKVLIVNRSAERAAELKGIIQQSNASISVEIVDEEGLESRAEDVDYLVNTTPVGMTPNTRDCPINTKTSSALFGSGTAVFDLVYNPLKTILLKRAEKQGCLAINGMQMLVAQAVYSVEIWMGGNILTHVDMNALVRDLEKTIK